MFYRITTDSQNAPRYITRIQFKHRGQWRVAVAEWNKSQSEPVTIMLDGEQFGAVGVPQNPTHEGVAAAVVTEIAPYAYGIQADLVADVQERSALKRAGRGRSKEVRNLTAYIKRKLRSEGLDFDAMTLAMCGDPCYFEFAAAELPSPSVKAFSDADGIERRYQVVTPDTLLEIARNTAGNELHDHVFTATLKEAIQHGWLQTQAGTMRFSCRIAWQHQSAYFSREVSPRGRGRARRLVVYEPLELGGE